MTLPGYVCVHGHFYQPARENPFTGIIYEGDAAAPYPNWNERITAECYAPNLAAQILGEDGEPRRHVNTFEWISFDLGPTILEWLKWNHDDVYKGIVEADRRSVERFGGHGSAMAQSYNHTILPLSNNRDRRTQIRWGIKDFQHRFGRLPEGMWLPETAVDVESLSILSQEGIRFTVLSPYQADSVLGDDGLWHDVSGGNIDTRVPYRVSLPDQRSIDVFFYNGPLSQEIAFNGILEDGHLLASTLIDALGDDVPHRRLAHVATDGESYGHHHKFGEMALAVAIEDIELNPDVRFTNYAEFRVLQPPTHEVRIAENTSWSCSHGVERWRSDCGCDTGTHPEWSQEWRTTLRSTFDWLRDKLIPEFEALGDGVLTDPWQARDDYIDVLLGTPPDEFIAGHATSELSEVQRRRVLGHMAIQQHLMLMYTSCGWFFDDVAGLETVIVLRQAAKAIDLARQFTELDLEDQFLARLADAVSNVDGRTARDVYVAEVGPYLAVDASASRGL